MVCSVDFTGRKASLKRVRDPLRILYVHNGVDRYGAGRMLVRTITGLDPGRFRAHAVVPGHGPLTTELQSLKVPCTVDPRLSIVSRPVCKSLRILPFLLGIPLSARRLHRIIRHHHIDLVHTNVGVVVSSGLAARLARVPHVWHIREWFGDFRGVWPLYARYIRSANRIVAISRAVAEQFGTASKVEIVHDGFDLSEFDVDTEALRREFRGRYDLGNAFVVGCVGRIKFVSKGQEILVQATRLLRDRGHPIRALIVGTPFPGNEDHLRSLKDLVTELQVDRDVILTGELSDVRAAYAAMDVLALTSIRPEGLGNVALEAMGMSRPVIASRIGGPLDIVQEGVTGWFVEPGNPHDLANRIQQLMENSPLRRQMGSTGKELLSSHFNLQEMSRRLSGIYTDLQPPLRSLAEP